MDQETTVYVWRQICSCNTTDTAVSGVTCDWKLCTTSRSDFLQRQYMYKYIHIGRMVVLHGKTTRKYIYIYIYIYIYVSSVILDVVINLLSTWTAIVLLAGLYNIPQSDLQFSVCNWYTQYHARHWLAPYSTSRRCLPACLPWGTFAVLSGNAAMFHHAQRQLVSADRLNDLCILGRSAVLCDSGRFTLLDRSLSTVGSSGRVLSLWAGLYTSPCRVHALPPKLLIVMRSLPLQ